MLVPPVNGSTSAGRGPAPFSPGAWFWKSTTATPRRMPCAEGWKDEVMSESNPRATAEALREEIDLAVSGLGGAMMGIADSYMELAYGAGKGFGVHAEYRESNLHTGKPQMALAVQLAAWSSEIAAKAAALDAKREMLKRLVAEGSD
ncbi:hypothetical protein [Streptomyces sp. MMBL 11-1]|uniref:hypothetical protein n=1 Tax=Streptomyces sp. MMBL 11-1 TaxID=3026420 RepID=UPI0023612215|nr:hypothetical protein [Streptomyces sp. MMBL 11-1]